LYASLVRNWIQWIPTSYRYWIPENVSRVFARGVENHLSSSVRYGDWTISLSGNYVFTLTTDESGLAEIQGTKGKQLIYIPRHHGNVFANVRWKTWALSYTLEMTGVRSTSYAEDDYFSYSLPSYVLHHLELEKKINKTKMLLRCNNIMDKDYQNVVWRAMPGRSIEFVFSYTY
jgi:Outer membrane cobalamin receptor protein